MQCQRCRHDNEAGAKFCEECGAPLARTCASCGHALSPMAKFCSECAHPTGLVPQAPAASRFAAPDAYTPRHLAERILRSRAALEGERKQVTVLFADLKGSMELLADRDPEEARQLLDPVLERMMEAVHRYEGTVNQVMGDGIMALFGAPLAHEDHAVRACYAALDLQAAVRRYAQEARRTFGVEPQVRVGLNSGEVVVRAIGSDLRMDYTAVGQTTHLAARMEQLAAPGSIRLTANTLRLAEGYVEVQPLGPVPVKGLEGPVDVFDLERADPLRSRLHVASVRGLTRFVGRDQEMQRLHHALGRAAAGEGQIVGIVGEPGVGKSRLVWEISHSHRTGGWRILQARSVSYGRATPYLPIIDLLKGYFQVEDRDDPRKIREKVMGRLLALDRSMEPTVAPLLSLMDVPVEDAEWQGLNPPERRRRTLEAVKHLLLRESLLQPLLVVFEDLHWVDTETQAFLDGLVDSVPKASLLLLVAYRPEHQHGWGGKTYYSQLRTGSAARGERRRAAHGAARLRPPARARHLAPHRAHPGQPVLPRGEPARARRDRRAVRGARRVPAHRRRGHRRRARHRPGRAGCAHRPAPAGGQGALANRVRHRKGRALRPPARDRGRRRVRTPARAVRAAGGRVPLRGATVPRPRVHVQACADPRGGLREPPPGAPARPARSPRGGNRAAPCGASGRAGRHPRPSRVPRVRLAEGPVLPAPGRGPRAPPLGQPGGRRLLRAGDHGRGAPPPRRRDHPDVDRPPRGPAHGAVSARGGRRSDQRAPPRR